MKCDSNWETNGDNFIQYWPCKIWRGFPPPRRNTSPLIQARTDFTRVEHNQKKQKYRYHPSWKFAGNLWSNVASIGSDKQCKMAWSGTWDGHSGTLPKMPAQPEIGQHLTIWHPIPFYLSMHIFQPVKVSIYYYLFRSLPSHLSSHFNLKSFCLKEWARYYTQARVNANHTRSFEMSRHGETDVSYTACHICIHLCYSRDSYCGWRCLTPVNYRTGIICKY